MKRIHSAGLFCLLFILLLGSPKSYSQDIVCKLDTIHACPGEVYMAMTVKNAVDVVAISVSFTYNTAVCTYVPSPPVAGNTPYYINPKLTVNAFPTIGLSSGSVIIGWYSTTSQDFPDDTLFKFKFSTVPGFSNFIWDSLNCEWNGEFVPQIIAHYKNGRIDNLGHEALVTVQPLDIPICESNIATFVVGSLYTEHYYWQVSTDGVNYTNLTNTPPYSGVDASLLMITNPPLSYNGYKYKCLVEGDCLDNSTDPRTLTITPKPLVNTGPDDSICAGSFFTLVASASNVTSKNWSHSGSGVLQTTSPDNLHIKYTPSAADILNGQVAITLTCAGNAPCIPASDQMILYIMPIPTAIVSSSVSVCNGETATLVASGGTTYLWSTGETNDTILVQPTSNTTYQVTAIKDGCSDDANVAVSVIPKPVVNASADATICAGLSFQPSVTGSNFASVLWTSSGNGQFDNDASLTPVYQPGAADISAGSVTLYVMGIPNSPCSLFSIDSIKLTITPFPIANAGPDATACQGVPVTLQASGGDSYEWSNGQTFSSITVSPPDTADYIVTVTKDGCSQTDTVKVNVLPIPNASAGNDTTICPGSAASLQASGGVGYTWSNGVNAPIILVYPFVTSSYSVTVTSANGCKDSADVTVNINPNLQINVNPTNPMICQGESVALNATSSHACVFTWGPSFGLDVSVGPNVMASPLYTINYAVTGTDALGCQSQAVASVTVFDPPLVKVLPWSAKLCKGESILLSATGAMSYYWEPPTGLSSNSNPNVIASPKENTTYYVTGTDVNGCISVDSTVIEVSSYPSVSLPDSVVVCNGNNFLLDATSTPDNCTYLWNTGNSESWIYTSSPGVYWVEVESKGCIVYDSTVIIPCTELFIPNAFTPDGDNLNDIFKVISSGDIKEFHMYIFSRWGEQIFESHNIDVGWDGRKNGEMCQIGVYNYLIEYMGQGNVLLEQEGKKYGAVLLLR